MRGPWSLSSRSSQSTEGHSILSVASKENPDEGVLMLIYVHVSGSQLQVDGMLSGLAKGV